MDFDKIAIFAAMKKRFSWLDQRQEVLAHNIANADTPGYRARDIKDFAFAKEIDREVRHMQMARTTGEHLAGQSRRLQTFREGEERKPYETAPAENSVILEEQMVKLNETSVSHRVTSELYRKHLDMFRTAIGKGR